MIHMPSAISSLGNVSVGALLAAPQKNRQGSAPAFRRRPLRLRGFDYSKEGAYFVTICTRNRECLFGNVVGGEMRLNDVGRVVQAVWNGLSERSPSVELDAFVVMPNHVHAILFIVGAGPALSPQPFPSTGSRMTGWGAEGLALPSKGAASSAPTGSGSTTLSKVLRAFKSISAIQVNRLLSRSGQPFWQRNYYEHTIRNEESLNRIREYIATNPLRWELDRENPWREGEDEFDRWLATFRSRPPTVLEQTLR